MVQKRSLRTGGLYVEVLQCSKVDILDGSLRTGGLQYRLLGRLVYLSSCAGKGQNCS